MTFTVRELHVDDPTDVEAALCVRVETTAESHPDDPVPTHGSVRRQLIGSDVMARASFLAEIDGEPAGLVRMMFRDIEGSRDIAVCNIEVRPGLRRRRVGTGLLRRAVQRCLADDKPKLIGTGVDSAATRGFWGAWLGLTCGLIERESRLAMAEVDPELMRRWIDRRTERAAEYSLRHVRGPFPPELREAVAILNTAMNDAPTDDLEVDPEVWTAADVEAEDELRVLRGEERWTTIVFDPEGAPVGLTAVLVNDDEPVLGIQNNTVVLGPHRGRGLGRWLKADMWFRLRADRPALASLLVENAASNDAMLAINDAMGFRETVRYADWQGDAGDLAARLGD